MPGTRFEWRGAEGESRRTPRTRARVAVHTLGSSSDLAMLQDIARWRWLPPTEDAAPAFGINPRSSGGEVRHVIGRLDAAVPSAA